MTHINKRSWDQKVWELLFPAVIQCPMNITADRHCLVPWHTQYIYFNLNDAIDHLWKKLPKLMFGQGDRIWQWNTEVWPVLKSKKQSMLSLVTSECNK